jgi:hypothetical protein
MRKSLTLAAGRSATQAKMKFSLLRASYIACEVVEIIRVITNASTATDKNI